MPRRYRSGLPALLITAAYLLVLAVAAVIALTGSGLDLLWRITVFSEVEQGVTATPANVLILVLAGLPWAWALWQGLRGPLTGPAPELDRRSRQLRMALYAAAGFWLLYALLPEWPWWAVVVEGALMWAVVRFFQPVLGGSLEFREYALGAGMLGYCGGAVLQVADILGLGAPDLLAGVCALAILVWTLLVLRAQRHDSRWRTATVVYGLAALVVPVVLILVSFALASEGGVLLHAAASTEALGVIWLARSAHDLADPRNQPATEPTTV